MAVPKAIPETCSECDECLFSWYDSEWHCGDKPNDIGGGMILDNDIYTTVHKNCPRKRMDEGIDEMRKELIRLIRLREGLVGVDRKRTNHAIAELQNRIDHAKQGDEIT